MNETVRLFLFLFLCIPLRLTIAYIPQVLEKRYLVYTSFITGLMGIGTLYLACTNSRLTASEGGGVTWWASYRFVHGMLLLTASVYLLRSDRKASIPLLIDVILGICLFFIVRVGVFGEIENS